MQRRRALKHLLFIAGGMVMFPSCWRDQRKSSIALSNLHINSEEENLLAEIVGSIIPESDSVGGKGLNLHLFVLKMVDDCHSEEDQHVFMRGLRAWNREMKNFSGSTFVLADPPQRHSYLVTIDQDKAHPLSGFFAITKRRVIQGYVNSEYVMKNEVIYELVPGRYNGYADA
ncbi:gluconate 2-dehydrogenase subunit 3 family protein [Sphingobacterium olei]|uniref:Gluconate 2-dehydrogenase subunit 3 family protein n=1 Tax=Sphingobacterium olei TaxID=2571155 RepID=A0A4U0NYJ7_9SPHI|nr:gluconate 2-dehydrogenase subunit 3 family protein [Sphingobacterium olei]TJZ59937.1 gluconate 2-dehydrogenase subunit 3 family protein [Sphingobacterium olei]